MAYEHPPRYHATAEFDATLLQGFDSCSHCCLRSPRYGPARFEDWYGPARFEDWYGPAKVWSRQGHSSTEAELISLVAGLRMDGIPALDLRDLVKEVFHSSPNQSKKTKDRARGNSLRDTTSNKHTPNQTS